MLVTSVLVAVAVSLIATWVWKRKQAFQVIKNMGLPGPKPGFIMGNSAQTQELGIHLTWEKWISEYGPTLGYYAGTRPVVFTKDLELVKQVFVKEFLKFSGRMVSPISPTDDKYTSVFFASGMRWRRLRSILSPSFSSLKLKEMMPLIDQKVSIFQKVMDKRHNAGEAFNIYDDFQKMTLDVIGCCAFGIDVNALMDDDDEFLHHCKQAFAGVAKPGKLMKVFFLLAVAFPSITNFLKLIMPRDSFSVMKSAWFHDTAARIIQSRKSEKSDRVDFIQLMLDAAEPTESFSDSELTADYDHSETPQQTKAVDKKGKKGVMTLPEMQANCQLFLLAGYETTSTTLAFIAYELALHQDIQDKVLEEIATFTQDGKRASYDTLKKLEYMDMVIQEVLRLHPIAQVATHRMSSEDCEINGLKIPKNTGFLPTIDSIHQDITHWGPEDPKLFVPERFTPARKSARHPMAWLPFGAGPRNCIGMRFATMEIKSLLAELLRRYRFVRCEETKVPLPVGKQSLKSPTDGVFIRLQKIN